MRFTFFSRKRVFKRKENEKFHSFYVLFLVCRLFVIRFTPSPSTPPPSLLLASQMGVVKLIADISVPFFNWCDPLINYYMMYSQTRYIYLLVNHSRHDFLFTTSFDIHSAFYLNGGSERINRQTNWWNGILNNKMFIEEEKGADTHAHTHMIILCYISYLNYYYYKADFI